MTCRPAQWADAAGAVNDQERMVGVSGFVVQRNMELFEQSLPGRQTGQRHGGSLGVGQLGGGMADDPFINELIFSVAAGTLVTAGIIDPIPWVEQGHRVTNRGDSTHGIPADDFRLGKLPAAAAPGAGIHRIDRDRVHIDQQIMASWHWLRQGQIL